MFRIIPLLTAAFFLLSAPLHAVEFQIELVSKYNNGQSSAGYNPAPSMDGRYVVFSDSHQVYRRDRATNSTILVSVSTTGGQGNSTSHTPTMTPDGCYVAFLSTASNLVPGDTPGTWDVFLRDLCGSGGTVRIAPTGGSGDRPAVSDNGRYIAFISADANIVPGDVINTPDVFLYDHQTQQTVMVSVSSLGVRGNGASNHPSISGDGSYIVFHSLANNLVTSDTNTVRDVFLHDTLTSQTTRISLTSLGEQANGQSGFPAISGEGSYVAFSSSATNLVSPATSGQEVFVRDLQTGENTLVSVSTSGGDGNNTSAEPSISANGRFVAFQSFSSNLVPNDTNTTADIFVHDLQTGDTIRVSIRNNGQQGDAVSSAARISADGTYVAFQSTANLGFGIISGAYLATNILAPFPDPPNATPMLHLFDTLTPTLTWNRISWADRYEIQVADNANFANATTYDTAGLSVQTNTLQDGKTYYWRVRGVINPNTAGQWSATQRFTVLE